MKKKKKRLAALLVVAACMFTTVPEVAKADCMTYDEASQKISSAFDTLGSDSITRIEIYLPATYNYYNDEMLLNDAASQASYHLSGETVLKNGTSSNAEIRYGGIVPVNSYNMNCLIYYIVSGEDVTWEFSAVMSDALSECFVATSKIPSDWETPANAVITEPIELIGYFIDSNTSSFASMDDVTALLNEQVQADIEEDTFEGETNQEENTDPIMTILLALAGVVLLMIIITVILIAKEKNKKETERSKNYVAKENEKVRKRKLRENDELGELIASYENEYADEEESESIQLKESQLENQAKQVLEQPSALEIERMPAVPTQAVQQANQQINATQIQSQANNAYQAPPQLQVSQPQPLQQPTQQGYIGNQMPEQYINQINPQVSAAHVQPQNIEARYTNGMQANYCDHAAYRQQQMYQNNHRVNQQVHPSPQKKVPAFARKQG